MSTESVGTVRAVSLDETLEAIERALDGLARRQEALAANVANVDTPGYRTVDVRFDEVLGQELARPFPLVRTSPDHLEARPPAPAAPRLVEVEGLAPRPDGNNVRLERELGEMIANRLRFEMALQWARARLRLLETAIGEGRGQ